MIINKTNCILQSPAAIYFTLPQIPPAQTTKNFYDSSDRRLTIANCVLLALLSLGVSASSSQITSKATNGLIQYVEAWQELSARNTPPRSSLAHKALLNGLVPLLSFYLRPVRQIAALANLALTLRNAIPKSKKCWQSRDILPTNTRFFALHIINILFQFGYSWRTLFPRL